MIALDLTFAASVRVIHRVHGHAANRRPNPAPTCAAGLSEGFVLMVEVANLANRGHALHGKLTNFPGRQLHKSYLAFLAQQLRRAARGTHHLSAAPGIQLQVMHHRAGGNVLELQRIAGKNVRPFACRDAVYGLKLFSPIAASYLLNALLLKLSRSYKFSAYSIIFSPSASFTYAFFQSRR